MFGGVDSIEQNTRTNKVTLTTSIYYYFLFQVVARRHGRLSNVSEPKNIDG